MEVLDYTPKLAGRPLNIKSTGGSVTQLRLYVAADRSGAPIITVNNPVLQSDGLTWEFQFTAPGSPGRYYPAVDWTQTSGGTVQTDASGFLDLPTRYDLVCSCEQVAVRLGVNLPITAAQRQRIEQEIVARQTDASNYINRPIFPSFDTQTQWRPSPGRQPNDWRAYPNLLDVYDDRVTILSATANPNGGYDLSLMIGLDGRNEPALYRYVLEATALGILNDPSAGMGKRTPQSISADGQSVEFEQTTDPDSVTKGGAGFGLDSLASLKRMSVFKSNRAADPPFPYRTSMRRYF